MVKNTQNGLFTCSDQMPDSLPRFTCCTVGKIGDNIFQPIGSCYVSVQPIRRFASSVHIISTITWRVLTQPPSHKQPA
ncbi:hypothetical protein Syun_007089 [Stephania yunnanensis]|uniref:Uncharacterized protein n=1 Tax=Stephania yunnanensis TaxID=152371 RepID=A0AAP0PYB1_9MAGN